MYVAMSLAKVRHLSLDIAGYTYFKFTIAFWSVVYMDDGLTRRYENKP